MIKIIGITPAMPSGSSMKYHDERNCPTAQWTWALPSSMRSHFRRAGYPRARGRSVNIYSSFMQRAYDQVIHDVCIQNLPVNFCLDRAGFAGSDGPTHHGHMNLAYFRCFAQHELYRRPLNESELRNLNVYRTTPQSGKSILHSLSKRPGVMPNWKTPFEEVVVGNRQKD